METRSPSGTREAQVIEGLFYKLQRRSETVTMVSGYCQKLDLNPATDYQGEKREYDRSRTPLQEPSSSAPRNH